MAVVINNQFIEIPGVVSLNWHDDPALRLKMGEDGRARREAKVTGVTLHTTKGWPDRKHPKAQELRPGSGADHKCLVRTVASWSKDGRHGASHLEIAPDGVVGCFADLLTEVTFHAGVTAVNNVTVGIEIYQGGEAELYQVQLDVTVKVCDFLCKYFGIARQIPPPYKRHPRPWIADGTWSGVHGHRDVSDNRGFGDPGDFVFVALARAGFEPAPDTDKAAQPIPEGAKEVEDPT